MIDFSTFFGELHQADGQPLRPHPWQTALAARLAAGSPPQAIVVPTGGGKTATIDALIWALAAQADRAAAHRTIGVRTVWAIDRRILVDEVYERAIRIATRLEQAGADGEDPLHGLAEALRSYTGGDGPPLAVARWRGQIRIEPRAHHPFQPQIITSTAAQVGSRLLFRGYGVGERSLALEAALVAVDSTICLDEVHLVRPLQQTVAAIREHRRETEPPERFGPLTLISLTATSQLDPALSSTVHSITEADEAALSHRLDARKRAILTAPVGEREADHVAAVLVAVERHLADGATRIACVLNTVGLAIASARQARAKLGDRVEQILLVGPQRPFDRRRVLERHRGPIFEREAPERPLLVFATQTIEVGLDADFDALVTQSASATALVQRFGRLNRAGLDYGQATVIRDQGTTLYAPDEPAAWAWLDSRRQPDGGVDMSPRAIDADGGPPRDVLPRLAPFLSAGTIELLQQTAPRPAAMSDPAVEPFLRGADEAPADDVFVCWRADLRLNRDGEEAREYRRALLMLAPPHPDEMVILGLRRLHALLAACFGAGGRQSTLARLAQTEADVEGGAEAQAVPDEVRTGSPRFVVLRDREVHEIVPGSQLRQRDIRAGDVVVLESEAGGYAGNPLAPGSDVSVEDIGNRVAAAAAAAGADRRVGIRLDVEMLLSPAARPGAAWIFRLAAESADSRDLAPKQTIDDLTAALGLSTSGRFDIRRVRGGADNPLADIWDDGDDDDVDDGIDQTTLASEVDERPDHDALRAPDAYVLVAVDGKRARPDLLRRVARHPPPRLADHTDAVAARARRYATALGDYRLAASLELAARAHDHGKMDDRIQAFFRRGTLSLGEEPLAKSVFGTDDRLSERIARRASGLPPGLRHEIASVAVLADHLSRSGGRTAQGVDEDLALHLVGTHHGLGRPWPRIPGEGAPPRAFAAAMAGIAGRALGDGLDGWAEGAWLRRFFSVTGRYGSWGTAYLEAILILADRTVSAEGN